MEPVLYNSKSFTQIKKEELLISIKQYAFLFKLKTLKSRISMEDFAWELVVRILKTLIWYILERKHKEIKWWNLLKYARIEIYKGILGLRETKVTGA